MLHDLASPEVPYDFKLGSTTAKAHGRALWPCVQVSIMPYIDTA
ncbi:hypothetical protein F383_33493 [Gossypium arboreum]|uniref:Uncharacterized protein n=1 Tax=Gossypium arboreum TaxID=29729 RepID=A0A0B0N5F4_GOSAR|nr:hypothetical protein F383_33493 [Gossypium arboreum]